MFAHTVDAFVLFSSFLIDRHAYTRAYDPQCEHESQQHCYDINRASIPKCTL